MIQRGTLDSGSRKQSANYIEERLMGMLKAGIIGATGYGGVELVRLLLSHPKVELTKIASASYEGIKLSDMYPSLYEIFDRKLCGEDEAIDACDVIFAAVPHGVSQPLAKKCFEQGKVFIDLGADFRLKSEKAYQEWYGGMFESKELHKVSVYGLCEYNREKIKQTKLIANPGCFPTSITLALYPALQQGIVDPKGIMIDSKSGATGAGKSLTDASHFATLNEGFHSYKIGKHRHTPEIEEVLSEMSGENIQVTFVPHLLPINRGILSTIYAEMQTEQSLEEIHALYCKQYEKEPFVKVLPLGSFADVKNVRMSNFCHISLHQDQHTHKLIITSAIDNMVKGAAGQAVQNMNLVFGFAETDGLLGIPPAI